MWVGLFCRVEQEIQFIGLNHDREDGELLELSLKLARDSADRIQVYASLNVSQLLVCYVN